MKAKSSCFNFKAIDKRANIMQLKSSVTQDGRAVKISIGQRFDFEVHSEFRKAYENAGKAIHEYVVDLGQTEYMDSSALGMLLVLREYAGGDTSFIKIINCNNDVTDILSVSNFNDLFSIA